MVVSTESAVDSAASRAPRWQDPRRRETADSCASGAAPPGLLHEHESPARRRARRSRLRQSSGRTREPRVASPCGTERTGGESPRDDTAGLRAVMIRFSLRDGGARAKSHAEQASLNHHLSVKGRLPAGEAAPPILRVREACDLGCRADGSNPSRPTGRRRALPTRRILIRLLGW